MATQTVRIRVSPIHEAPGVSDVTPSERERPRDQALWAAMMFAVGLAFTGIFDLIARGTYDFDEFVYLLLGQGVTRGQLPYRDFLFYHPPGMVLTMALLQPLLNQWWVWGRVLSLLLAAGSCALVYLVGRKFMSRPVAVTASLLFAANPIVLTSGTRIMPDIYVTFFTLLAVYLLLAGNRQESCNRLWAVLAGMSFAVSIYFKYPAVLVLPAALLAAGRKQSLLFLGSTVVAGVAFFSPFLPHLSQLYNDTVVYQQGRFQYPLGTRILSVILFGVLLQPLAVFGFAVRPVRWWLVAGYLSGAILVINTQVYYHYMLPIVPFASILAALYLSSLRRISIRALAPAVAAGALALTLMWSLAMEYTPGNYPFHITSAQAAAVTPVLRYIDARVSPRDQILDDQPDLPVLAYRRNCQNYFWSDATVITHSRLESCLLSIRYIVHFFGGGSGFPVGFLLRGIDGSGTPPLTIDDKYCRTPVGVGSYGAYVYDTTCGKPYLPPRN